MGNRDPDQPAWLGAWVAIVSGANQGMALLDQQSHVLTANDEARRLLAAGGPATVGIKLPAAVHSLLAGREPIRDELAVIEDRVLIVSLVPVSNNGFVGSLLTIRDYSEVETLVGRLRPNDDFTQALRSQAHESANRLHTVVSLVEMGEYDEAVTFAVAELQLAQNLADRLIEGVSDPVLAALLLGKSAQGAQRGIELVVERGTYLPTVQGKSREMVTILGNLIDNSMQMLGEGATDVERVVRVSGSFAPGPDGVGPVVITVSDSGPGVPPERWALMFAAGWTTKTVAGVAGPRGLGLALVGQAVRRLGGRIAVGDGPGGRGAMFTVRFTLVTGGAG